MATHILIVDDEADLAEMLVLNLERAGYTTSVARDGREALAEAYRAAPDLILLDVMLPVLSGVEVAGRLRANPETASVPIVMLTARTEEADELVGLTAGADDYVTKPFSMKLLMARIEAVLRRASDDPASGLLRVGAVELNTETYEVAVGDDPVQLTLTEFRLLRTLMAEKGRVLSRRKLMAEAMGPGVRVTERTIDVHLTAIRKKLGTASEMVQTVRGVGYRLVEEPSSVDSDG